MSTLSIKYLHSLSSSPFLFLLLLPPFITSYDDYSSNLCLQKHLSPIHFLYLKNSHVIMWLFSQSNTPDKDRGWIFRASGFISMTHLSNLIFCHLYFLATRLQKVWTLSHAMYASLSLHMLFSLAETFPPFLTLPSSGSTSSRKLTWICRWPGPQAQVSDKGSPRLAPSPLLGLPLLLFLTGFRTHLTWAQCLTRASSYRETKGPTVTRLVFPQLLNPSSPPEETSLGTQGVTHTWLCTAV